ncbi:MAG TPA: MFS transporter [Gaiella sp.]|nr:MFS transporter [Gaiella sp.]
MRSRRAGFAVVTGGYLATTTAEATLAPAFPLVARELDLGPGFAGVAFGVLAAAIAVGSLVGGVALARLGPRAGLGPGVTLVAAGCMLTALAGGTLGLVAGQVVLGLGSGLFFASGLRSAAVFAGYRRRGRAMGLFGVAFSAGLALGGALAALGDVWGWRTSFVAAAGLAAVSAVALALVRVPDEETASRASRPAHRLRDTFGVPVAVGGVASASQYGTIGFLALYAVGHWGVSPATAALLLTAGRILSVPAKLVSGNASDSGGALPTARRLALVLAVLGACWTLLPGPALTVWAALLFIACVSALGPLANVLALERLESRAELLGAFRAAQIGIASLTALLLGAGAELVGLRATVVVAAVAIPSSLLLVGRRERRTQSRPALN